MAFHHEEPNSAGHNILSQLRSFRSILVSVCLKYVAVFSTTQYSCHKIWQYMPHLTAIEKYFKFSSRSLWHFELEDFFWTGGFYHKIDLNVSTHAYKHDSIKTLHQNYDLVFSHHPYDGKLHFKVDSDHKLLRNFSWQSYFLSDRFYQKSIERKSAREFFFQISFY